MFVVKSGMFSSLFIHIYIYSRFCLLFQLVYLVDVYHLYSRFCLLFKVVYLVDIYFYIVDFVFVSRGIFSRYILLYSRFCVCCFKWHI